MTNYLFSAGAQGWTGMDWEASVGSPALGALVAGFGSPTSSFGVNSAGSTKTGLSIPVANTDPFSYRVRIINDDGGGDNGNVTGYLRVIGGNTYEKAFNIGPIESGIPFDSGWSYLNDVITATDTITSIEFSAVGSGDGVLFAVYLDSVYVAESPASSALRHLGLSADNVYLYRVSIIDGVLTFAWFDLETLTNQGSGVFGSISYSDPDDLVSGLYPQVRSGLDGMVFVYGEDGADAQLQVSLDNGQTFSDLSDAGWTGKFMVALLADPLRPIDLVAAFADDDLYRSQDTGQSWSKIGDAPDTLRRAARPCVTLPAELLLAAQAADTLAFTNNYGDTFADVSDSVGTVNVIRGVRG